MSKDRSAVRITTRYHIVTKSPRVVDLDRSTRNFLLLPTAEQSFDIAQDGKLGTPYIMSHERRIFIENLSTKIQTYSQPPTYSLNSSDENFRYLSKVLRLKIKDEVTLVCKQSSNEYNSNIAEITKSSIIFSINQNSFSKFSDNDNFSTSGTNTKASIIPPLKTLLFAICKGDTNDLVCEKATELGVNEIIFWKATRSVPVFDAKSKENKAKRWEKIAQSAASQSGRKTIPIVKITDSLQEALEHCKNDENSRFYCSLEPDSINIHNLKNEIKEAVVAIGPEGDFTQQEIELLKKSNYLPVSLGDNRLRSETAAIVAIALFQNSINFDK